ncbi:MAG: hypothetical protein IJV56_02895, partial [Neisseriaceae bacterium]|nr:hypothetical protein [Neisseriaceae bacterium]
LTTTMAAALVALAFFVLIQPANVPVAAGTTLPEKVGQLSYYEHFLSVIPNNLNTKIDCLYVYNEREIRFSGYLKLKNAWRASCLPYDCLN